MAEEKPASKKDFKDIISDFASTQAVAAEKRRKDDQIKYNKDQARLVAIAKELEKANATKTLELEQEKVKIQQERSVEKFKQESGSRGIEIRKASLELQKTAIEATGGVAEDNQDYRDEVRKQKLADLAQRKLTATSPAALKEIKREENELLGSYFQRFLGKDSRLASGLTTIGEGLKAKVKGGFEGIFKALKAGAFVAFLLGMAKFLESETFQDIKDKYLPAITKGLEKLGKALKNIAEGFFTVETDEFGKETYKFDFLAGVKNIFSMIGNAFIEFGVKLKAGFFDEEGNFQLLEGLKNVAINVGLTAAALAGFALLMSPGRFFGKAFVMGIRGGGRLFGGTMRLIASGFGLLFPHLTGFSKSLTKTSGQMSLDLKKSKTMGGAFGKGVKGIMGSFGRLFFFLGKGIVGRKGLVGLLLGAGLLMANKLKDTKVFTKITSAFGKMFTVLSDLGAKIANTAAKAGSKLAKPLGRGAAKIVEKAGERAKYLASIAKPLGRGAATFAEKAGERAKYLKGLAKGSTVVGTTTNALLQTFAPQFLADKSMEVASNTKNVGSMATSFKGMPISSFGDIAKNKLSNQMKLALRGSSTTAKTAGIASKAVLKSIIKKLPLISLIAGMGFGMQRLSKGEYHKAYLEVVSGALGTAGYFTMGAGTAASLAIDAGLLADDLGITVKDATDLLMKTGKYMTGAKQGFGGTAEIDTSSLSTSAPPDFVTNNPSTRNLSGLQIAKQSRAGGTLVNAPVTNINNTSNNSSNTSVMNRTLVMQDPLLRSAINAM